MDELKKRAEALRDHEWSSDADVVPVLREQVKELASIVAAMLETATTPAAQMVSDSAKKP
jgi:hypothetical protein